MLTLVYPPEGHTTAEDSVLLNGSTLAGASVTCNNVSLPVNESGFFAGTFPLNPGDNEIQLSTTLPDGSLQKLTRGVHRTFSPPLGDKPEGWVTYASPQSDIRLCAGRNLILSCLVPTGSDAVEATVGEKRVVLTRIASPPDHRQNIFGERHHVAPPWPEGDYYEGQWRASGHMAEDTPFSVIYSCQRQGKTYTFTAPGTVQILPAPVALMVTQEEAPLRTRPLNGSRLTPQLAGTPLRGVEHREGHWLVKAGETSLGWVHEEDVSSPDLPESFSPGIVHGVNSRLTPEGKLSIEIQLDQQGAHSLELAPRQITLTLFGVHSQIDVMRYTPEALKAGLSEIRWQQTAPDVVTLTLFLDSDLWGLSRTWNADEKHLQLTVKTAATQAEKPRVIVLDPGHGGEELGAPAPDGTPEKDINLRLAQQVYDVLKDTPNLTVYMTRCDDQTVSLEERVAFARRVDADLLVSLHHNALPDGRNPLEHQGLSTYYYQLFVLPLAKTLHSGLITITDQSDYGVFYDSLAVCRPTDYRGILIERGFLTHPDDAAKCLGQQHQQQFAQTILQQLAE